VRAAFVFRAFTRLTTQREGSMKPDGESAPDDNSFRLLRCY
jgi:hypothetical protein